MDRADARAQRGARRRGGLPLGLGIFPEPALAVDGEPRAGERPLQFVLFALLGAPAHALVDAVAEDPERHDHGQQAADDDAGLQGLVLRFGYSRGQTHRTSVRFKLAVIHQASMRSSKHLFRTRFAFFECCA